MKARENLLRGIRRDSPAWVPNGMESVITIPSPVVERPAQAGRDDFGCRWALDAGAQGGTYPALRGHPIKQPAGWRSVVTIPNVDAIDWEPLQRRVTAIDREEYLVSGFVEMGLFERTYLLMGMEEALMAYLTEPEQMEELVEVLADYKIALIDRMHRAVHMDILWYGDDWGTQNALFLPPDTWRRIIKPHTERIYNCLRERGVIINQHSCGKIESIFPDMVDMGADMWNPCQPCNDLASLKRSFGDRISFCGGIDSQFVLDRRGATTEDVRREVRRRIDEMAGGGGYVAAPSHGVPYDEDLVEAMNDEIRIYGRQVYSGETPCA